MENLPDSYEKFKLNLMQSVSEIPLLASSRPDTCTNALARAFVAMCEAKHGKRWTNCEMVIYPSLHDECTNVSAKIVYARRHEQFRRRIVEARVQQTQREASLSSVFIMRSVNGQDRLIFKATVADGKELD